MASKLISAIAACLVFTAACLYPTAAGSAGDFIAPAESAELTVEKPMRHPSAREFVSGPWPRFVKKMLA